jgi:hypothetical protein
MLGSTFLDSLISLLFSRLRISENIRSPTLSEPPKLLKGFEKLEFGLGRSSGVSFLVEKNGPRIWDETVAVEDWRLVHGNYTFIVGSRLRIFCQRRVLCFRNLLHTGNYIKHLS